MQFNITKISRVIRYSLYIVIYYNEVCCIKIISRSKKIVKTRRNTFNTTPYKLKKNVYVGIATRSQSYIMFKPLSLL